MNPRKRLMSVRGMRGMTLIELLTAVAIVGILAAIAYPSYMNQMRQTRRADGKSALLDSAQRLERCFTRFNAYNAGGCDTATDIADGGMLSPEGWYLLTIASTATTYTLTATPQNDQTNDGPCGTLTVTHRGARGASGTAPESCW